MTTAIVCVLALVQSLFGVGLLLVGTPILLLLGIPFTEALWTLLPASLTVSTLQLLIDRRVDRQLVRSVALFAVPALVVGLVIALRTPVSINLTPAIAALLALAAILRISGALAVAVRRFAAAHQHLLLAIIGFVHGLTNMGGSLLLDFAASRHSDKMALRQQVALGYVVFAASQLLMLTVVQGAHFTTLTGVHCAIAGGVFLTLGRRSFRSLSQPAFSVALSGFMLAVAVWLAWRSL